MDAEKGLLTPPPPYAEIVEKPAKEQNEEVKKPAITQRYFYYQISAEAILSAMWFVLAPIMIYMDPTHQYIMMGNSKLYTAYMIPVDIIGTVSIFALIYGFRNTNPYCILPTIVFQILIIFMYFYMMLISFYTFYYTDTQLGSFLVNDFLDAPPESCAVGADRFIKKISGMLVCICSGMIFYITGITFLYIRLYFYYILVRKAQRANRPIRISCAFFLIYAPLLWLGFIKAGKTAKTAPSEGHELKLVAK